MKRYIRCQARSLSDIGADLEQNTPPVIQSLIQLYLYPNASTKHHWRQEVWANLHTIDLRRGSNKLPKRDFILKNTIVPNMKFIESLVASVIDKEYEFDPIDVDYEDLCGLIDNYFDWLATRLSETRYVAAKEVYTKLQSIRL
mgnify:CR=1 FL=1